MRPHLALLSVAYSIFLTSIQAHPTIDLVKRESIPSPWACSIIDSIPPKAQQWSHYYVPIISGHQHNTNSEGVTEHLTQVQQEIRLTNKEPHRTYQASFRENNDFTITEFWSYANSPTLSTTYYEIAFTADGGRHPTKKMVIKMPPQHGDTNKWCSLHIDGVSDQQRTFTLNAYFEPLNL